MIGWYLPGVGYRQTDETVSPEILATYPEGTIQVPLRPNAFDELAFDENGAPYWVEGAPPPPEVPAQISKLQLKRAASQVSWGDTTLWEAAKAALLQADADAQEDWDLAQFIPRDDQTFVALAAAIGADSDDIDAVFILGASL